MINWDKIEQLLNIISKGSEHGPNLSPIVQFAQQELAGHMKEAQMAANEAKKIQADKDAAAAAIKQADEASKAESEPESELEPEVKTEAEPEPVTRRV